jgi:S-methylmethionine-dependent homocysteine/selenocysteine methylase
MYAFVEQKLMAGETIILDGGTGTEIQRRGVPMHDQVWCAEASVSHPEVVRAVHCDYLRAGAEVITANTFATSPLLFNAVKRDRDIRDLDRIAVRLVREAVEEAAAGAPIAIAGSFSTMRPVVARSDRTAKTKEWTPRQAEPLMHAKAEALAEAGCDLIIMEMMRDVDYSLWATEAAVATGLPVWVGVSVERRGDRRLAGYGRPEWVIEDIAAALMATGAKVCLVMHTAIDDTADALALVKSNWAGPIGAYPEAGHFEMPNWVFEPVPAGDFVEHCRRWRRMGATLLGGCCGIGPDHIAALSKAFRASEDKGDVGRHL